MNYTDLLIAMCLMAVVEGLFLLAAPQAFKRMAARILTQPDGMLRIGGGMMAVAGLVALQLLRM
jgi:uncharacterized protein YjeT (DUF2065 family)